MSEEKQEKTKQFDTDMEFLYELEMLMRKYNAQIIVGAYGGLGQVHLACEATYLIGEDEDIDADDMAKNRARYKRENHHLKGWF